MTFPLFSELYRFMSSVKRNVYEINVFLSPSDERIMTDAAVYNGSF